LWITLTVLGSIAGILFYGNIQAVKK